MNITDIKSAPDACYSEEEQILMATGRRLGRLVVAGLDRNEDVVCSCDCSEGEFFSVPQEEWLSGVRYQCQDCDAWAAASPIQQIIGDDETYEILVSRGEGAKDRCRNPNNPAYADYGGRGIMFLYPDAEHFALDMFLKGFRAGDERTTDRIDVNGHYEPENTRLATATIQVRNRRVSAVVDTGEQVVSLADLAEEHGISVGSPEYGALARYHAQTRPERERLFQGVVAKIEELTSPREAA